MLDLKPPEMDQFYYVYNEGRTGTLRVAAIDIESLTFLPPFLMQYHDDETIFRRTDREVCLMRLVIDKGTVASPTLVLLDNDNYACSQVIDADTNPTVSCEKLKRNVIKAIARIVGDLSSSSSIAFMCFM
ncbi:unnamed protein product [Gongylonema pulchrum]|uniref:Tudor domain-containing protein n=1 Tax=Gongylonema pulchrum TaxID=637853 RepID=A0A183DK20_9BILA|nr:unnamed protein product [Gongylonema pulchrum]